MVGRIGYFQTHANLRSAIKEQGRKSLEMANQMGSQKRVQELRQDPVSAALGSRYHSLLTRKEVYSQQNRRLYDSLQLSEGYMRQLTDLLQNARGLALQSANGTLNEKDRKIVAIEVNEIIEEMFHVVNAKNSEGRYLFGGDNTNSPPFYALRTTIFEQQSDLIQNVEYLGSNYNVENQISEQELISASIPGSKLIWSGQTRIYSNVNLNGFALQNDTVIHINGKELAFTQGDTLPVIIEKINSSDAAVQASQAPITGELVLETSNTEQIWLKDLTGTMLQDLGIITDNSAPHNISPNAQKFNETVFSALVDFRNALYNDDVIAIGGRVLGAIDRSMQSVLENLGRVGAVSERLDIVYERIESKDILNITAQLQDELSIDFSDLIVKWRDLQQIQQATYAISNTIMNTSLLNYLK